MSLLATIRRRHAGASRRALGLVVALWLNMVIAPCAMSLETDAGSGCPHCPPSQEVPSPAPGNDSHCGGGVEAAAGCALLAAQCGEIDRIDRDGRAGQSKLEDAPTELPPALAAHEALRVTAPAARCRDGTRLTEPVPPGASPPLHVLHCVYLD